MWYDSADLEYLQERARGEALDKGAQAMAMWKLGFGNMNDELFPERKDRK